MKHKILLAVDTKTDISALLEDLFNLLNKTHLKYISLFYPERFVNSKSLETSSDESLDSLVKKAEKELTAKEKAYLYNMSLDTTESIKTKSQLSSLSTVYDLLIWEQSAFSAFDSETFKSIVQHIKCPFLMLPKNWEVKNLIILHDGSVDSVRMTKSFINLFSSDFLELPLSILMTELENGNENGGEKAFIEYLKLFFKNIGIQLMCDNAVDCLNQRAVYDSERPFLMLGGVNNNTDDFYTILRGEGKMPMFIFKV